ncbi:LysM peptidoglycan-binding domain-containing protein [Virgibacillus siamensis]|uniref:LysM peptidoglycan-binding domain-containing protein n=1 Tax=Virgibacillus siamensis TaxID=480071 RepID=UPI0009864891|nr:LysM peptidoglycan-binding domain-containing protein [Virgibacillus siamensis]
MKKYVMWVVAGILGMTLFSGTAFAEINYKVEKGDTIYSIARSYQVDADTLIAANAAITNPNYIKPGQVIMIPDENGSPFTITAYTAGYESTGKHPGDPGYGITASGTVVEEGRTIACPQALDFGTKIHIIKWDETYVCEDRGSSITNGDLDIYMRDLDDALRFGVQELQVKVWD